MTSSYSDMAREGEVGNSVVEALYATVSAVVRLRRIPPPEGYERWDTEAVTETAHDFLVDRDGHDRLQDLFRLTVDDDSFDRLLHVSVRNFLSSRARSSERGALLRRLRSILESDDRFWTVEPRSGIPLWTLSATKIPEPYTGRLDPLIAAAREVEGLKLVRWKSSNRHGPIAERESLVFLCEVVLRAAGTAMRLQEIADVVAARFNLVGELPSTVFLDEGELPPAGDTEREYEANETAAAIWEQLTERERALFPFLDSSAREVAARFDLGKSQMAVSQERIRQLLRDWLSDDPASADVLRALQLMAERLRDRTDG